MEEHLTSDDPATIERALAEGRTRFLGLDLLCVPGVLVPRAETELLARTVLAAFEDDPAREVRLVDVGCGAGNLTCALAAKLPRSHVWACDVAPEAATLTERNAARLGLEPRVTVRAGDLFDAFSEEEGLRGTIDAVVCNPPYISSGKLAGAGAGLLRLEPTEAFDGGPFGIGIHQRVAREAVAWLRPTGRIFFEVGAGQARQVLRLLERAGGYADARTIEDERGLGRVVEARRGGAADPSGPTGDRA